MLSCFMAGIMFPVLELYAATPRRPQQGSNQDGLVSTLSHHQNADEPVTWYTFQPLCAIIYQFKVGSVTDRQLLN